MVMTDDRLLMMTDDRLGAYSQHLSNKVCCVAYKCKIHGNGNNKEYKTNNLKKVKVKSNNLKKSKSSQSKSKVKKYTVATLPCLGATC